MSAETTEEDWALAQLVTAEDELTRFRAALLAAAKPIPCTKGLGPKDRAERLHAEMERRVKSAKEALRHVTP